MTKKHDFQEIDITQLVPFKCHPFKLYEGQRFSDMVESVRTNGVLEPIIVRIVKMSHPREYEILAGHNRVEAAKAAGLSVIPAIVHEVVSDEQAALIVTLTNLQQRGFGEMLHSERATVIKFTYDALKKQGQRNDLINEIDNLLNSNELLSDNQKKLSPKEAIAERFGMKANNIACYLRLHKLIEPLIDLLDEGRFELSVAESLTYLNKECQGIVCKVLNMKAVKLTIGKAKSIVKLSQSGRLTIEKVQEFLTQQQPRKSSYKLNDDVFKRYLADKCVEDIDNIVEQALEMWSKSQGLH